MRRGAWKAGASASAGDDVMDGGDHRLARVDAGSGEDRHQRLPERVERLLRVPYVEHLQPVLSLERDVIRPPGGSALPGVLKLLDDVVVLSALIPCTAK